MGGRGWSGLKVEELTEVKWELRELAMDDGLFELKDGQFSGGAWQSSTSVNKKLKALSLSLGSAKTSTAT